MCTVDHMSSIPHKENEENKMQWDKCYGLKGLVELGKERPKPRGNRSSCNCTGDVTKTNRQSLRVYYNILV